MKKLSKLMAPALSLALALSLAACSGGDAPSQNSASPAGNSAPGGDAAGDGKYAIGICQLAPHPALDAATQGFKDALVEKLGEGNVEFKEGNASGDSSLCPTIIDGFVAQKVDLILANATAPLQAAASATSDIPVLGTSVTDYATALEIDNWNGTVGTNVSGTSDLAPLDQQAAMIQEVFPRPRPWGCSTAPASPIPSTSAT